MTPEQKQFYEKLGDTLVRDNADMRHSEHISVDKQLLHSAAQKLHDLWPTLCDIDEAGNVYDQAMKKPTGVRDVPLARLFFCNEIERHGTTISKAVGGGNE